MNTKELLGARIKELRKKRVMTQDDLAEEIGVDPKHLSRIEVGRSYPSLDALERIATALRVDIRDFFDFEHLDRNADQIKKELGLLLQDMDVETLRLFFKIIKALRR